MTKFSLNLAWRKDASEVRVLDKVTKSREVKGLQHLMALAKSDLQCLIMLE